MPSEWISHVKRFQAQHGVSYKDALKGASASYRSMKGGNITKTATSSGKTLIDASTERAVRALAGSGYGGKIGRVKKAGKWQQFVDSTLHDTIDTANKARKTYDKGSQSQMMAMGVNQKFNESQSNVSNSDRMNALVKADRKVNGRSLMAMGLKKHKRKLSGMALYPAGM